MSASQQGWQQSEAVAVAEEVLECMRGTAYTSITAANFPNNGPDLCSVSPPTGYTYTVTISNDTPITNTKTVTVAVTFQRLVSNQATTATGSGKVSISTIFATK